MFSNHSTHLRGLFPCTSVPATWSFLSVPEAGRNGGRGPVGVAVAVLVRGDSPLHAMIRAGALAQGTSPALGPGLDPRSLIRKLSHRGLSKDAGFQVARFDPRAPGLMGGLLSCPWSGSPTSDLTRFSNLPFPLGPTSQGLVFTPLLCCSLRSFWNKARCQGIVQTVTRSLHCPLGCLMLWLGCSVCLLRW